MAQYSMRHFISAHESTGAIILEDQLWHVIVHGDPARGCARGIGKAVAAIPTLRRLALVVKAGEPRGTGLLLASGYEAF